MYSSIGVGTVTMNTRHGLRSARLVVKLSFSASASSAASTSSVLSHAAAQLVDALRLDVEADGLEALAELDGERQAHIAETDDRRPSGCGG